MSTSNFKPMKQVLDYLQVGKKDLDALITPVYICYYDYNEEGIPTYELTDDLKYAQEISDDYELASIEDLNSELSISGCSYKGTLTTSNGLCTHFNHVTYNELGDIETYISNYKLLDLSIRNSATAPSGSTEQDLYINHLYSTCDTDVESFYKWMTDVHYFSVDGWVMRNLRKYIVDQERLTKFFNRYKDEYGYNSEYLLQCSIDMTDHYKSLDN